MKSTKTGLRRAAIAMLVLAFSVAAVSAGETMTPGDIAKTFSGMTLDGIYFNNTYFTETYNDDGTIRYHDTSSADSGKWFVRKGQFCTFYDGQEGACFTVEKDGANCFTFYEEDPDTGKIDHDRWTSRGWNRAAGKATCPTAPEVEI
jgi:hypothetical protein